MDFSERVRVRVREFLDMAMNDKASRLEKLTYKLSLMLSIFRYFALFDSFLRPFLST
jgi:hypothetical protein